MWPWGGWCLPRVSVRSGKVRKTGQPTTEDAWPSNAVAARFRREAGLGFGGTSRPAKAGSAGTAAGGTPAAASPCWLPRGPVQAPGWRFCKNCRRSPFGQLNGGTLAFRSNRTSLRGAAGSSGDRLHLAGLTFTGTYLPACGFSLSTTMVRCTAESYDRKSCSLSA